MSLHNISSFEKTNNILVNSYALELSLVKEKQLYTLIKKRLTKN